ncbi:MAG: hypothetical protein MHM6MM_001678 [Cercozoa sp. M6MM]
MEYDARRSKRRRRNLCVSESFLAVPKQVNGFVIDSDSPPPAERRTDGLAPSELSSRSTRRKRSRFALRSKSSVMIPMPDMGCGNLWHALCDFDDAWAWRDDIQRKTLGEHIDENNCPKKRRRTMLSESLSSLKSSLNKQDSGIATMRVDVSMFTGCLVPLEVTYASYGLDLKRQIFLLTGVVVSSQRLLCHGKEVLDDALLFGETAYRLGDVLHCVWRV